jgi:hypothetical protein
VQNAGLSGKNISSKYNVGGDNIGVPTFFPSKIPAKEAYLILIKATTEVPFTSVVGNHCLSTKGSGFLFHYSPPSRAATMV